MDDQGKPEEAIAHYKKAISLVPNDALTYYNLGITLGREQQPEEAIVNLKKARELFQADENKQMVEQVDQLIQKINPRRN
ncbi:MAG: tetratricopeptide repeat protein [Nostoc sp. NMS7]|nr:tetratricopeptide repeat protein [Nostoc sp. NMS7]